MTSRRKFLKLSAAGASLLSFPENVLANTTEVNKPIAISTWDFGLDANEAAWKILKQNGKALDAVEAGVKVPEADPTERSVGYGGLPDRDGHVTLDACIMDEHGNCGSVACLEHIMHPISVARAVMEKTPHVMLVGDGALQFALSQGFEKKNLLTPQSEKTWKEWAKKSEYKPVINIENHDTIGMLALDNHGNLSGACTTSGMAFKMHGRVGDSPIIGAGLYVDNEVGAATATGMGEEVIRIVGCHLVVELMRQGKSPEEACRLAVERIIHKDPVRAKNIQVGFLALHKKGSHGAYCIQPGFTYALHNESGNKLYKGASYYS
ncbi:MAG TPA: N(4)-(beta-N-acetylglucosaminyl)-L-asparaginase [Ohtaekwangia sp.]|nr:N(4)-(beta-N-acetylglucosaminyl)-L-asparaginase [Ohtaekwangia sp.]